MDQLIKTNVLLVISILIISGSGQLKAQNEKTSQKIKTLTIFREETQDNGKIKSLKESSVTFDPNGNVIEEIEFKENKVNKHFKYNYDENNNKIKETEYNPSGSLIRVVEYKYVNNLKTEKLVFNSENKLLTRKKYIYTNY